MILKPRKRASIRRHPAKSPMKHCAACKATQPLPALSGRWLELSRPHQPIQRFCSRRCCLAEMDRVINEMEAQP